MANVVIFKTGQYPQYLTSVNTPDYSSDPNTIVNPDMSAVSGVPLKFWKRSGNNVLEMTQAEKDTILTKELQARKDTANDFGIEETKIILTALIKVLNTKFPANKQITKQEIIDALKVEII